MKRRNERDAGGWWVEEGWVRPRGYNDREWSYWVRSGLVLDGSGSLEWVVRKGTGGRVAGGEADGGETFASLFGKFRRIFQST